MDMPDPIIDRVEAGRPWDSVASYSGRISEFHFQWERLSQKLSGRAIEEDTWE